MVLYNILAEYPPYGRDIQLVPAEGYSGAFGPFMTLGFQPNILVKMKNIFYFGFRIEQEMDC